jgi:hypothetical protein
MGGGGSRPAPTPPYDPCSDGNIPYYHYNSPEWAGAKDKSDQRLRHINKREGRSWKYGQYYSCVWENQHIDRTYYRDTDTYLQTRFVTYNVNGSQKWCQLRNRDKGWNYAYWNIKNERDFYNYCIFSDRAVPSIRIQAGPYVPPRLTSGTSTMDIGAKALTAQELGNVSGNIQTLSIPEGWAARVWSGLKFDGMSIDYMAGSHKMENPSMVRSIQVSPSRPVVLSGSYHAQAANARWSAHLRNDEYRFVDLDDGTFAATYYYTSVAAIQQVLVPIGFKVSLYSGAGFTGTTQTIHGHNTNGWVAANFMPKSVFVKVIVPVTFSKSLYSGFPTGLVAGRNTMNPSRQVASMRIPPGYVVTGKTEGAATRQMRGDVGTLDKQYQMLEVKVEYETRTNANMIDDMPVKTKTIYSKIDFADICKKECDKDYNCSAYYAVKMMRECPNPSANDGQTEGGCKAVCGMYDESLIRFAKTSSIEPYLFEGNLNLKQVYMLATDYT